MINIAIIVSFINLVFATTRLAMTLKNRRLISIAWFMICYFSFFLLVMTFGGSFTKLQGFTLHLITVQDSTILFTNVYVLICNLLFAIAEILIWKLFGNKAIFNWELPQEHLTSKGYKILFGIILAVASVFYAIKMQGLGYREYVEYNRSDWTKVFLWASTPFITIAALQKKYVLAFIGVIPFVFFALYLHIRSFALVSLVPLCIILFFQMMSHRDQDRRRKFRIIMGGIVIVFLLFGMSFSVTYLKSGKINLPDAGIPYGMNIAIEKTIQTKVYTGWTSLQKYSTNLIIPFLRLLNISPPDTIDTPVHIANLIDGVPKSERKYYHYPALWYADAFVSFGKAGIFMGLLWGLIFALTECLMRRNLIVLAMLLPFYTWHTYMVLRGAVAIATGPLSYALYIQIIIVYFVSGYYILTKKK